MIVKARIRHRRPEVRQGVQPPSARVNQRRIVVLPAGLVLLRAVVVIHRYDQLASLPRRRGEVDRRLPAVRPDLQDGAQVSVGGGRPVQGQSLTGRPDSLARLRRPPEPFRHGREHFGHRREPFWHGRYVVHASVRLRVDEHEYAPTGPGRVPWILAIASGRAGWRSAGHTLGRLPGVLAPPSAQTIAQLTLPDPLKGS